MIYLKGVLLLQLLQGVGRGKGRGATFVHVGREGYFGAHRPIGLIGKLASSIFNNGVPLRIFFISPSE